MSLHTLCTPKDCQGFIYLKKKKKNFFFFQFSEPVYFIYNLEYHIPSYPTCLTVRFGPKQTQKTMRHLFWKWVFCLGHHWPRTFTATFSCCPPQAGDALHQSRLALRDLLQLLQRTLAELQSATWFKPMPSDGVRRTEQSEQKKQEKAENIRKPKSKSTRHHNCYGGC